LQKEINWILIVKTHRILEPKGLRKNKGSEGAMEKRKRLGLNLPEFSFDTPEQLKRTCEDLFYWQGVELFARSRLHLILAGILSVVGFANGLDPAGYLYGPIGAVIGAGVGFGVGWAGAEVLLRVGLAKLSFSLNLERLIIAGRYREAGDLCKKFRERRERVFKENHRISSRLLKEVVLAYDWIFAQHYSVNRDLFSALFLALEGILREANGDVERAVELYQESLKSIPNNAYIFYALVSLWEIHPEIDVDRKLVENCLDQLEQTRSALGKIVLGIYRKWLEDKLAEERVALEEGIQLKPVDQRAELKNKFYKTDYFIRLIENPGSPVSSGLLEVEDEEMVVIRLAPMPFQLAHYLASAMKEELEKKRHPDQQGWVSVQELVEKLPWTVGEVDASNVHKLVYKLRKAFREAGVDENLIEYNNGCYRISTHPSKIQIEKFNP